MGIYSRHTKKKKKKKNAKGLGRTAEWGAVLEHGVFRARGIMTLVSGRQKKVLIMKRQMR